MRRLPDWDARLVAFVEAHRRTPFAYGTWDCCICAIEAVRALTGQAVWAVSWTDEAEAMAAIAAAGGLVQALTRALGRPSQNWREARRGDIVLADQGGQAVPLLCLGVDLCGPGLDGLEFKPLPEARLVWRI